MLTAVGRHKTSSTFGWADYNRTKGQAGAYEELVGKLQAAMTETSDLVLKADLSLTRDCFAISKALFRDGNPVQAAALGRAALEDQQLLEQASAKWESYLREMAGAALRKIGEPQAALDCYENAAAVLQDYYSYHHHAPELWKTAALVALDDLRQAPIAIRLLQRAVDYTYRWGEDFLAADEQPENLLACLDILARALKANGDEAAAGRALQQKAEVKRPLKATSASGSSYDISTIVAELDKAASQQLSDWIAYANQQTKSVADNDALSLWRGAEMLAQAYQETDSAAAIQLAKAALRRFDAYQVSPLLINAYRQAAALAHKANLPGLEQEWLDCVVDYHKKLYGDDDRLTLLARAAQANGPLARLDQGRLLTEMGTILETAQEHYVDDTELQSQLRSLTPAEILPPEAGGDISPERQQLLDQALAELEQMIGLDKVKEQVKGLVQFLSVQRRRQQAGMARNQRANHLVFTGPPGTGKTTVARLLGQILYALEQLPTPKLVEAAPSDLIAGYIGQTAIKTRELLERSRGGVLFIDEAYQIVNTQPGSENKSFGGEAMAELLLAMENSRDDLSIVFAGYQGEMSRFLEINTGLSSRITEVIDFPAYSDAELAEIFQFIAGSNGYKLEEAAFAPLAEVIAQLRRDAQGDFGNGRAMRNLFEDSIVRQAQRLAAAGPDEDLTLLSAADLREDDAHDREQVMHEALAELDRLVGLAEVKRQIHGFVDLRVIDDLRRQQGLGQKRPQGNLAFAGPLGTGKTTIARLLARILYGSGQLATAEPLEITVSDLTAEYLGQTAVKTRQLFHQARGRLLFIDQAGLLNTTNFGHNYIREALAELVKLIETESGAVTVVLSDTTEQIEALLRDQPALATQIAVNVKFPAYQASELEQIWTAMLDQAGYQLTDDARSRTTEICQELAGQKDGGNGHDLEKLLDHASLAQASRLRRGQPSAQELVTLEAADLDWQPPTLSHSIGFA